MKLHQIYESDLADLERMLPQLLDAAYPHLTPKDRTQWRRIQTILMNVRWNYGPPGQVEIIDIQPEGK